jgi:hypothetical protein
LTPLPVQGQQDDGAMTAPFQDLAVPCLVVLLPLVSRRPRPLPGRLPGGNSASNTCHPGPG